MIHCKFWGRVNKTKESKSKVCSFHNNTFNGLKYELKIQSGVIYIKGIAFLSQEQL